MLEDEERGPAFHFLQGFFRFGSGELSADYIAKNCEYLAKCGKPRFVNLQHFNSYTHSPHEMRFATLMGKLCEIEAFSAPYQSVEFGFLSLLPDLAYLGYPVSVVRKALCRMSDRAGNPIWYNMAGPSSSILRTLTSHFHSPH